MTNPPLVPTVAGMKLELHADDVRLQVTKDDFGRLLPTVEAARNGRVLIEFAKAELEAMLLTFARAATADQKVKIESAELTLSQAGPRGVAGVLRVRARQMISATVLISGQADVDQQLNVTLHHLAARGEGMAGNLAAGFIAKKLTPHEGRHFALPTPALRALTLSQVEVDAGDPLRITARFEG